MEKHSKTEGVNIMIKQENIDLTASEAFEQAIATNRLSTNKVDPNYAGNYMYMGHGENGAKFKNINSRQYDV